MPSPSRPRIPQADRAKQNTEALIANFNGYLAAFEAQGVFEGPSLYFHERALERRHMAPSLAALLHGGVPLTV